MRGLPAEGGQKLRSRVFSWLRFALDRVIRCIPMSRGKLAEEHAQLLMQLSEGVAGW